MAKKLIGMVLVGFGLAVSCPATAGIIVAEKLLVDLRADDLPLGPVTEWRNHGTLGNFTARGIPVVEVVDGRKAVTFANQSYFVGPRSVPGIEGRGTRSIEVWVYNPAIPAEETMVSWSHRGGPDGTNMVFNYGNNTSYGAVGHWASADMAWAGSHAPAPAARTWWHLVYTYDGTTARLYVNGQPETSRTVVLNTHANAPIRVAAQSDDSGEGINAGFTFTGSIAEVRIHDGALSAADVAKNFQSKPSDVSAGSPNPAAGAKDVPRDVPLSWGPGDFAKTHDVYLGTTPADVNNASRTNALGVLASRGQDANSYDPPAVLEYGKTYYWRIDEVNGAPDNTIFKGDVWTFIVEPFGYPITGVTATASSSQGVMVPANTVNGSGLNAQDQHSTDSTAMWMSSGGKPAWIQFQFDKTYKLHQMLVWNSNQLIESMLGFGAKDVTVEYSLDGQTWTALKGVPEFAQALGTPACEASTTVAFGGVEAKFVKLIINANWGGLAPQTGLSEVRFLYVPVQARSPQPTTAAKGVSADTALNWRPGREAASHKLYLGTDPNAVANGTAPAQTATDHSVTLDPLNLGTTYYWRVDEVNAVTYPGEVWSFTTQDYQLVDDFESYTDKAGAEIFTAWVDGFDNPAKNGAVVSIPTAVNGTFGDTTTFHAGRQSMPLAYDNTKAPFSEATRTFASPQDWTRYGITTLVVYFRGNATNSPASLYVKINDKKVLCNGGAPVTALPLWKQWNIDLAAAGANLKSVKTLTIGIGDGSAGSKGILHIDDLLLYRTAPALVGPLDPGAGNLMAYYQMEGNAQDSSGKNYHGTISGNIGYEDGPSGKAMIFNGTNAYVTLPIGPLIATLTDTTVATNVYFANTGGAWQRIFDFGSNTTAYMFLCPRQGTTGAMRFAIRTPTVTERIVNAPTMLPSGWHHVAVVIDSKAMRLTLYLDGVQVGSAATTILPKDMGNTTQNWLGKSQYAADAYFTGSLDEFRIYNRALSASEIRYLAGDR